MLLFDNIEKCNLNILDKFINIINDRKIKDKSFYNSIIFLNATNKIYFNIGFNSDLESESYNNKSVINIVDYVIKFNNIREETINKYIEYNGIKDFDINKCDYVNYGFRGVKIGLNNKKYINS